jgi:hypothetical protein
MSLGTFLSSLVVVAGTALVPIGPAASIEESAQLPDAKAPVGNPTTNPQLISDRVSMYPRGVQLAHNGDANGRVLASVTTFTERGGEGQVFESHDDGRSFEQLALIPISQNNGQRGLCCGTIFELPQQVGDLPEGTLLYSASVGQEEPDRRMELDIWQSQDAGGSWSFLSTCASSPDTGGLWEPEFSVDKQGRLVCHYAHEEPWGDDGVPVQRLIHRVSDDGLIWSEPEITVDAIEGGGRPGMPIVRTLPDGTYFMVFEVCLSPGQYDCATYSRRSTDGTNWGDPTEHGQIIFSQHGRYFQHAPTVAWADNGTPDGTLMVIGQLLTNVDGSRADGNGKTIFVQRNPRGPWLETRAPVEVPDAFNHFCPNYSSALVPLEGGRTFIELASDIAADGECKTSFARGKIRAGRTGGES